MFKEGHKLACKAIFLFHARIHHRSATAPAQFGKLAPAAFRYAFAREVGKLSKCVLPIEVQEAVISQVAKDKLMERRTPLHGTCGLDGEGPTADIATRVLGCIVCYIASHN